jgi:hypothetical protein
MAIIQDIFSPVSSGDADRGKKRQAAVAKLKQIHQATIIPTPTMEPVKRMYAQRIAAPAAGHYQNFRPHPLLVKHQQDKARTTPADAAPTAAKPLPKVPIGSPAGQPPTSLAGPERRIRSTDGITAPRHAQRPPAATQPQSSIARSAQPRSARPGNLPQPVATPQPGVKPRHKIFDFVQYPLIAAAAIGAAYSTNVGQAIIGVYFLLAIIFKVRSQITFGVALLLLISIPFFQIIHLDGTSENAAVYAFEMLVAGTVQAMIELWRDNRKAGRVASSGESLYTSKTNA